MGQSPAIELPLRSRLLPSLHAEHERAGYVSHEALREIAASVRVPVAEAWEALTSYPEFRTQPAPEGEPVCTGLSCALNGAMSTPGQVATGCRFRCYEAPVSGAEAAFEERFIHRAGPLLSPEIDDWAGLDSARSMGPTAALAVVEASGLRGRGGAYFPVARKWSGALEERRPIALVVNAEEGEPGVFKDRAMLGLRPRRFIEGLAIACRVLEPRVLVIFLNGEAAPASASLVDALGTWGDALPLAPLVYRGGGGYVLGEESAMLNAIEGRKPVPRLRPPFPVESGLFGMPTVINNVETLCNLSVLFREGAEAFRSRGTAQAPGTKLMSVSGRVGRPGLYEVEMGTPLAALLEMAGPGPGGAVTAVLAGGPSGGFLPPALFDVPLLPGLLHPTGAVTGSGSVVCLDAASSLREAALSMARFNAEESCGKCTPCREGAPRAEAALATRALGGLDDLLETVGLASLCGLGQMAPGPIRSALHFWPELFA